MHVIMDCLTEVLEDSCKSWMKGRLNTKRKSWQKDRVSKNNRRGTVDTKLLFTWNVRKMDGVWPQIFLIDVHGFTFHKKQASRLLWWAVKGRRLQLKWSEVSVMVGYKLWFCLRCFHILTGTTTQKDHAGVSQKFNGTPGGYSHEDTQVDLERKSLYSVKLIRYIWGSFDDHICSE